MFLRVVFSPLFQPTLRLRLIVKNINNIFSHEHNVHMAKLLAQAQLNSIGQITHIQRYECAENEN